MNGVPFERCSDGPIIEADEPKPGSGGKVSLWSDDEQIGEGTMERTVPITFSSYAGMDIGCDNGLVADLAYEEQAPYRFTGEINEVVFDLKPMSHEEAQTLHQHEHHHSVGQGVAG